MLLNVKADTIDPTTVMRYDDRVIPRLLELGGAQTTSQYTCALLT